MSKRDCYEILGVDKTADDAVLKKAKRKLASKWHPDRHPDNPEEAQQKMAEVNEAYDILADEEMRKVYDQYGRDGVQSVKEGGSPSGNSGKNMSDVAETFGHNSSKEDRMERLRKYATKGKGGQKTSKASTGKESIRDRYSNKAAKETPEQAALKAVTNALSNSLNELQNAKSSVSGVSIEDLEKVTSLLNQVSNEAQSLTDQLSSKGPKASAGANNKI